MFSHDRRKFDTFDLTFIINHQKFIMHFIAIINNGEHSLNSQLK